jgi:hypothetical protein
LDRKLIMSDIRKGNEVIGRYLGFTQGKAGGN